MPTITRKAITRTLIAAAVLGAVGASTAVGGSSVTKARLERSLPQSFSNMYVQQAAILGHKGITAASLHAKASCDKGGPNVPDVGAGADWICLMSFDDPNVPLPDGNAKFELNVHSNDCYTVGGPSKFIGLLTITDTRGKTVDNPVFEWDACFDPSTNNTPTGVAFDKPASSSLTPTQQRRASAVLTLPTGTMSAADDGEITPSLNCSDGKDGCGGTITATAGKTNVTVTYALATSDSEPITLQLPKGTTGPIQLKATPVIGTAPKPNSTITIH